MSLRGMGQPLALPLTLATTTVRSALSDSIGVLGSIHRAVHRSPRQGDTRGP